MNNGHSLPLSFWLLKRAIAAGHVHPFQLRATVHHWLYQNYTDTRDRGQTNLVGHKWRRRWNRLHPSRRYALPDDRRPTRACTPSRLAPHASTPPVSPPSVSFH